MNKNDLHEIMAGFAPLATTTGIPDAKGYPKDIGSLFNHFVAAEAIDYHLRRSLEAVGGPKLDPESFADFGELLSAFRVVSIYYSMIQVVVEGYLELGCEDKCVNEFLKNSENTAALRRFRNANFHYQKDPLSPKLLEFLECDAQGEWVRGLFAALNEFFKRELKLESLAEHFKGK